MQSQPAPAAHPGPPQGRRKRVSAVIERNISTLVEISRSLNNQRTTQDRMADTITDFSGSMWFVYVHAVWFAVWIAINLGWTRLKPFDPFPFGLLTMIVSLEAIFLATFVLISQN